MVTGSVQAPMSAAATAVLLEVDGKSASVSIPLALPMRLAIEELVARRIYTARRKRWPFMGPQIYLAATGPRPEFLPAPLEYMDRVIRAGEPGRLGAMLAGRQRRVARRVYGACLEELREHRLVSREGRRTPAGEVRAAAARMPVEVLTKGVMSGDPEAARLRRRKAIIALLMPGLVTGGSPVASASPLGDQSDLDALEALETDFAGTDGLWDAGDGGVSDGGGGGCGGGCGGG